MHRRSLILVAILVVVVVAGATISVVAARAQGESSLTGMTPAELIVAVSEYAHGDIPPISGELSWKNDLLGLSMLSFGGQGTGDFSSLLAAGKGRLWVQNKNARFEIQGVLGDTTITADDTRVWVYSSSKNTATEYTLPEMPARSIASDAPGTGLIGDSPTSLADPVTTIESFLEKLAPDATVELGAPVQVAGRDCYLLSLTPKAPNTVFGSVEVAIDGETYVPLKLDVFAKGDTEPVLTAGFTSVSYKSIDGSIFAFTPPANAAVEHKTLTLPLLGSATKGADSVTKDGVEATLSLVEAAAKADFTPLAAQTVDPNLAFSGAYVIPAKQVDLKMPAEALQSGVLGSFRDAGETRGDTSGTTVTSSTGVTLPAALLPILGSDQVTLGPTVVQSYGRGFGTVILVEAKVPDGFGTMVEQALAGVPFIGSSTVGGNAVYQFGTSLGSAGLWETDGLLCVAVGSVSQTDLTGFIASVR